MKRVVTFLAMMAFALCASGVWGGEASERPLVVCGVEKAPFRHMENGKPTGLDVDIIARIMETLGASWRIDLVKSSPRHVANWEKGLCDMVLTYSYKPEREAWLEYPRQPHVDISWNFFVRAGDKKHIRFESYGDLAGLRIGATDTYAYTPEFWEAGKRGAYTLDVIVRDDLQLSKLLKGRIDAVPLNTISALYIARERGFRDRIAYLPKPLITNPYYNTFVKASTNPALPRIRQGYDAALRDLIASGAWAEMAAHYGLDVPPPRIAP